MVETEAIPLRAKFANAANAAAADYDMRMSKAENLDARNLVMAQIIVDKFAAFRCNKGVVVVGAAHIWSWAKLEGYYGFWLDIYKPLQILLNERGLPSVVVGELHAPYKG